MQENPLSKFYRQPKIYISLPSQGTFYPPNTINGDPRNLPVYGMTAMDEIMFKTPDALFTGEAVVQVIQSCIPAIKDAWLIPQIDIDSILIALRIATYGEMMPLEHKCSNCGQYNDVELDLPRILDSYQSLSYNSALKCGELTINFRPLTYKQQTQVALRTYQLQRKLYQVSKTEDEEEKNKSLNDATKEINQIQFSSFKSCIYSIEVDNTVVTDPTCIDDWFQNTDKTYYDKIKKHLLNIRDEWALKAQPVECTECKHVDKVEIGFDNSNFFGNP